MTRSRDIGFNELAAYCFHACHGYLDIKTKELYS